MAGQNFQRRVLWATAANFAIEASRCCGTCVAPETPSLKVRKVVEPDYPETARRNGVGGTVVVEALIDKHGIPDRVRILRGDPTLAAAAREAVCQWRWQPPHLGTETVPIAIAVNFEPE
jgi:TonB family protein